MSDRQELEHRLAELRKRNPRNWALERMIRAALESIANRAVVWRALEALRGELRK